MTAMAAKTMTAYRVADARALADRLMSRGCSKSNADPNTVKTDMRTAARMLWWLLRDFAAGEVIEIPAGD